MDGGRAKLAHIARLFTNICFILFQDNFKDSYPGSGIAAKVNIHGQAITCV